MKPYILFINTDQSLASELSEESEDYHFIHCETFSNAIKVIEESQISLIIIDTDIFEHVEVEEFDLFKSLALYNDTSFIYLTNEDQFLQHRVNANCIDVIAKPISAHKLITRIHLVLTDQREKLIFQGYIDDYPIHDLIKIAEQILFTGVIMLEFNYEKAKLIFENGRLERALLDFETDWAVLDYILSWKSGDFQIYGNIDSYSENLFLKKKFKSKDTTTEKDRTKLTQVLKDVKLDIIELMGIAVINQDGAVIAENIIIELINLDNQRIALKTMIKQCRLLLLSLNSSQLDELNIGGDKHNIFLKQIGKRKLYYVAYFKKGANVGIVKYVLQKYENTILEILDSE